MDEGEPIAYQVLERGIPVLSSDGEQVGTVDHVVAAVEQDIFHGIVIHTPSGRRFVEAADVESLHERGVDLLIDAEAAAALPEPHGASRSFNINPGAAHGGTWGGIVDRITGRGGWRRGG
jgi:uncharacterized protein YrrD